MQQLFKLVKALSSPAVLIVVVWGAVLIAVAVGPIDYSMQPSPTVVALVVVAISLFILAHRTGAWCFDAWLKRQASIPEPSIRTLSDIITASALAGIAGIGLIAFDRLMLSGVSNGGYAELLRCAPTLVDIIEIKRTPVLYVGYVFFSFGFASLLLFVLKGDEIRGWPATLAQLSIVSPIGYALLYAGRMPILLIIVLIISAMLVRIRQGKRPLPDNHHLVLKMTAVFLAFVVYSSAMWATRQNFCVQMSGLIRELQQRVGQRELERHAKQDDLNRESSLSPDILKPPAAVGGVTYPEARAGDVPSLPPPVLAHRKSTDQAPASDMISAADLNKMVDEARRLPPAVATSAEVRELLEMLDKSWHVKPRAYVISAMNSGLLSPSAALGVLGTYFYFTHGVRILDMTWQAREQFSPHWGVYEIGIFSPVLRVFFPDASRVTDMDGQLKSAKIHGFFPTVWAAAYIDFGLLGAILYLLIWGFSAGWSASGARGSAFATPSLLLVFNLASIVLSPVQGPLGIANSALVLLSMMVAGLAADLVSLSQSSRHEPGKLKLGDASPSA